MRSHRRRTAIPVLLLLPLALFASACSTSATAGTPKDRGPAATLRLGYFPNITHATAIVGVSKGFFATALGTTKLETQTFNAGPAAIEALTGGSIDAAYVGPSPAVNAFVKTHGDLLRIVAGATTGGAELVVKRSITSPTQLKGTTLATPQTGGTQDVALRYYLQQHGFQEKPSGAGDATIISQDNAQTLATFKSGGIDGAWVPEPWASRLVLEGGGHVLVDEKSLWPGGTFVTTNLVVSRTFLAAHPATVKALIAGELATDTWITANPAGAKTVINDALTSLTGKALKPAVLDRAFADIVVTLDPVASSLQASADHGVAVGLLKKADLHGIYDLTLLNQVLTAAGKATVDAAGLGGTTS